ncbi:FlgD immunoglobulin-like domain containing protein [Thermospira aquatica]|uniref:FlgD/Vpr Ig-like domain-containing protein n=1 Tax=Thermospira aquatica TaxID=2828656 RepID=A0AAX3BJ20_9SPIR|nr:FlgD immunoglobulin-like domain containing protein [Thermospira aquatica]URA11311.1 hypothetical protein KDW03_05830 [Thermospira aquatica]
MKAMRYILFLALAVSMWGRSLYYYQGFSDPAMDTNSYNSGGWQWNFPMSRDMMVWDVQDLFGATDRDFPATVRRYNGLLEIYGRPNKSSLAWNNWYIGDGAKFSPAGAGLGTINATPEEPFGFTVIRYTNSMDPRGDAGEAYGYSSTPNQKSFVNVWIASDNGASQPYDRWNDFAYFFEKQHWNQTSTYGFFETREYVVGFPTTDIDGVSVGTAATITATFQRNYDDNNQNYQNTLSRHFTGGDGYFNPVNAPLGIRVTHDGRKVSFYVNYNPLGTTPNLSNAWVKVGEKEVPWSTNLVAFLSTESPFFREGEVETQFDHFLIRTVASNLTARISPVRVMTNRSLQFKLTVHVETAPEDSGVQELYIKKPAGYGAWNTASVALTNSSGGVPIRGFINNGASAPTSGRFQVKVLASGDLYIRFWAQSQSQNDIIRSDDIDVYFTLTTPSTPNPAGDNFEVYVDSVKHTDTAQDVLFDTVNGLPYATTGRQKAREAFADSLRVRVYSAPQAYAKVEYSPSPIIIGTEESSFTVKLSTEGLTTIPPISSARIYIPSGFTVSNNTTTLTNIVSTVLGASASANNIRVTNISGSNFIWIYYTNLVTLGLPPASGFDKINFKVYGTPLFTGIPYSNYLWQVEVNSDEVVSGVSWAKAGTNIVYSSQLVRVASSNAQVAAAISPAEVAINAAYSSNAIRYSYTIKNDGPTGNNVHRIFIQLPGNYSDNSVSNITVSTPGATAAYSNGAIWVTYGTPLSSGATSTIQFWAAFTNTNVTGASETAEFILYADNNNSAGYTLQYENAPLTWRVSILPPRVKGEHAINVVEGSVTNAPEITTDKVSSRLIHWIYNTSPKGVMIQSIDILYPQTLLTNIVPISSSLTTNTTLSVIEEGNYFVVRLAYTNFLSLYDDVASSKDQVVVDVFDSIELPTNFIIPVRVYKTDVPTSDFYSSNDATIGIMFSGSNRLYVNYPLPEISWGVKPGDLDSTTETNRMTWVISNRGLSGNKIYQARLTIPTNVTTNIVNTIITNSAGTVVGALLYTPTTGVIQVNFSSPLVGGETAYAHFDMVDHVDNMDLLNQLLSCQVTNDRGWFTVSNIVGDYYSSLNFRLPKPSGGGWVTPNIFFVNTNGPSVVTQQVVVFVTNTGGQNDRFNSVEIKLPLPWTNTVAWASSTLLGLTSTNSGFFTITPTNVRITYPVGSHEFKSGMGDYVTLELRISNRTTLPVSGTWQILANNGFVDYGFSPPKDYFEITNVGTEAQRQAYGTAMLVASLDTTNVTRTVTNGQFRFSVTNGIAGGMAVKWMKIEIPSLYVVLTNTITVDGYSPLKTISNNAIWLDFSASELVAGANFTVDFQWKKGIQQTLTNQFWRVTVAYSSNFTEYEMDSYGAQDQNIINVPLTFYAAVSPNKVNKDLAYMQYTVTITNTSEEGNNITLLKIVPPSTNANLKEILTNITGVNSSRIGNNAVYSNDGVIYVDYLSQGTSIKRGEVDTIVFTAYDRENTAYFSGTRALSWQILAANASWDLPTNQGQPNLALWTNDLSLEFVVPPYKTVYAIAPTNLNTVDVTNTLEFALQNTSESFADVIERLRISIPWPFRTNTIAFVSTKASGYTITNENGTNYLEISYPVGRMAPGSNDIITLKWLDDFEHGETNTTLALSVRYTTSGSTYVEALPQIGATNVVNFKMPVPEMRAGLVVNEIYTTLREGTLTFVLTNKGYGQNTVQRMRLEVPEGFTNILDVSKIRFVSPVDITNTNVILPNIYEFYPTGLLTNQVIRVEIDVTNTLTNTTYDVPWVWTMDNGYVTTNITILSHVIDPGSAELIERTVASDKKSHTITLKVYNNTPGLLPLLRVKVEPNNSFYTNINSITSSAGTISNVTENSFWIVYTTPLAKGSVDTVTMTLYDNTNQLITNDLEWKVWGDNGTEPAILREKSAGALKQNTTISKPDVTNIWHTSWYIIPGNDRIADFRLTVSNRSADEVVVITNILTIPAELTNITPAGIATTHPRATLTRLNATTIQIVYSAPYFVPGESDTISFQFTNSVGVPKLVDVSLRAYNKGSQVFEETRQIDFTQPPQPTEGYIKNRQTIYSIDNYAVVTYVVRNGLYDRDIKEVMIASSNEVLLVTNIRSVKLGRNLSFTTNSTNIVISYGDDGILHSDTDELRIELIYTNNANWTNDMPAKVRYDGSINFEDAIVPTGEQNILPVLLADFGRVRGVVLPGFANPSIKLYKPGTSEVATNKFGELLVTGAAGTGAYTVDFAMPGIYDVGLSGRNYREVRVRNIEVFANVVTNIGTNKMEHDLLSPDATGEQTVVCLDDMETAITFPSGTIGENFRLDIWITNMTPEQQEATGQKPIQAPLDKANAKAWIFVIRNAKGKEQPEQWLRNDATITIAYDPAYISAQGWSEEKLSIYYWRATTKQWVKLGGVVDRNARTVKVKVSYLHKYYTVMADIAEKVKEGFISVRTDPKVFTPRRGGREVQNMKLSIVFEKPVEKYVVKIYDLKGNLVYKVERSGEFANGEVYWDGKDLSGYDVAGGVYVYKIEAGGYVYSGTIVIAR